MKKNILKFLLILSLFFIIPWSSTLAEEEETKNTIFKPQVTIPGSNFEAGSTTTMGNSLSTLGDYIKSVYDYLILIVGLVAVVVLMVGGIIWLTSAGNSTRISQAKTWIGGSLTGLVLAFASYLILQTINPKLVNFRDTQIDSIGIINTGCCRLPSDKDTDGYITGTAGTGLTRDLTSTQCYLRAAELKEPGLKTLEDLKKDPKYEKMNNNDMVEKYLGGLKIGASTGWFLPNYISINFSGCSQVGICLIIGDRPINARNTSCFRTSKNTCDQIYEYYDNEYFTPGQGGDRDYMHFFSSEYHDCNNFFVDNFVVPKLNETTRHNFENIKKEHLRFRSSDEIIASWKIYKYNSLFYFDKGKLGEPCGDEKDRGICVPSGKSCTELEFESRNSGYGGRSCGSGFKCCNQK